MFTSAAPYDPLFWPLHGLAERFVQMVRLMDKASLLQLDDITEYSHNTILSDTDVVCDWSNVDPRSMELPRCTKGVTCPGHRADDILPFQYVLGETNGLEYYTNAQFYDAIAPWEGTLPYVYD